MQLLLFSQSPELVALLLIFLIVLSLAGVKKVWNFYIIGTLFVALQWFYRMPDRSLPSGWNKDSLYSPSDGRVSNVERIGDTTTITVFLCPLDVHVQYMPCDGKLISQDYFPGKFNPAFYKKTDKNERFINIFSTNYGEVKIEQVAGVIVRSIATFIKKGTTFVSVTTPIGMIKFGSQVKTTFHSPIEPTVKVGDYVHAGRTVFVDGNVLTHTLYKR